MDLIDGRNELVDVVEECRGVHEAAVVPDTGPANSKPEEGGDLGDRAGVRDEPGGRLKADDDGGRFEPTWDGHPGIVGTVCGIGTAQLHVMSPTRAVAVRGPGRGPVEETRRSAPSVVTVTVPSVSVRRTLAPVARTRSIVCRLGCPYGLPVPALTIATRGTRARSSASVVAVPLP